MTREELIQECRCDCTPNCQHPKWDEVEPLVDFILHRQKFLLEKIGKPLREERARHDAITSLDIQWGYSRYRFAIDSALAIIEKEGGE